MPFNSFNIKSIGVPFNTLNLNSINDAAFSNSKLYEIQEDAIITVPEIIVKYGYPVEIHTTVTQDGYVLQMHRIPYGKQSPPGSGKPPILIKHGFVSNSADSVLSGPSEALAYYLADLGFDVWLGNARGNRYSNEHISINPSSRQYWDFTFTEVGVYDIPAMIDYILQETKEEKLFYIGHSRGTTSFYIMCSERPEYNKKIRAMVSMAPVAYMGNIPNPIIRLLTKIQKQIEFAMASAGITHVTANRQVMAQIGQALCSNESPTQPICVLLVYLLGGFDTRNYNASTLPLMLGHLPDNFSVKELSHFGQLVSSGRFQKYDYGYRQNLDVYNNPIPPSFNLSAITAPVALFYSQNDWQSSQRDAERLFSELGNPVGKFLLQNEPNHYSYNYGKYMRTWLYSKIVKLLRSF